MFACACDLWEACVFSPAMTDDLHRFRREICLMQNFKIAVSVFPVQIIKYLNKNLYKDLTTEILTE